MREMFTMEIDSDLLRRLKTEAKKIARSPASYVGSLVVRAVYGRYHPDVEVVAAGGLGQGRVMRGEDESDEDYDRRRRSVEVLRNPGKP